MLGGVTLNLPGEVVERLISGLISKSQLLDAEVHLVWTSERQKLHFPEVFCVAWEQ